MHSGLNEKAVGQDCVITGMTHDGVQVRAGCRRLDRHTIVFEVYTPQVMLHSSEVLTDLKIAINERTAYEGRAIIKSLIGSGTSLLVEATLEDSWTEMPDFTTEQPAAALRAGFAQFLRSSSNGQKVLPEIKLVVADLQAFLLDLQQWIAHVELSLAGRNANASKADQQDLLEAIDAETRPILARLFERFEDACRGIDPDLRPAHAHYVKRLLHPLVLCSPFMYRSFHKPLGYAGDYEMVNMMMAEPYCGNSSFAKVLNSYFLSTPPVVAHQNRVAYLTQMLQDEICQISHRAGPVRVFNLGCGPALEIQEFLAKSELSNQTQFTLLDFNDETIEHVSSVLRHLQAKHRRATSIQCNKKSVVQLLKDAARPESAHVKARYDVVYCAGLFDYLTTPVCEKLMSLFYGMLAPGGLLIATNVYTVNPSRNWMEYSVDWHLIYRDRLGMLAIRPQRAPVDACVVKSDPTGLNLFMEVRKPADA